ncbi:MAG TPA: site-specific DNA-methyltransferase [Pyrinomonadaceae bacterium]|nr:site-specific DNA-methyltransferase [Pyrinomonadaceae bacterium]
MNTLYYGDNLKILREYIKDETVDLIYLDPPFNSNRNYNVLFRSESGSEAESQITAFEDTWKWGLETEATYKELVLASDAVGQMIESFRSFIGENQMMAYLTMMAIRLKELHRVLKPTGSLYLHCDPTASHYLKILLDTTFGNRNYVNEIIWKRTSSHNDPKQYGRIHDTIFYYGKGSEANGRRTWNRVFTNLDQSYVDKVYVYEDEKGRYRLDNLTAPGLSNGASGQEWRGVNPTSVGRHWRMVPSELEKLVLENKIKFKADGKPSMNGFKMYLSDSQGLPLQSVWTDLPNVTGISNEKLGYPTQKPVALLERILKASSNEGDVVLDPFCGCGTTIAAAQNLGRQWIGIDVTHLAVGLQKNRLKETFGMIPIGKSTIESTENTEKDISKTSVSSVPSVVKNAYKVIGQPEDLEGAKNLAENDRYGFQWWILPLVGARALGAEAGKKEGKKGSDRGIDGTMAFIDDTSGKAKKIIFSVKSGHVNVSHIRDLGHVVEREKAAIGVYVTLEPPTKPMITEAVSAGFYHSDYFGKDFPRIQILTVEDILAGRGVQMPAESVTFKKAAKEAFSHKAQQTMFDETEAEDGE